MLFVLYNINFINLFLVIFVIFHLIPIVFFMIVLFIVYQNKKTNPKIKPNPKSTNNIGFSAESKKTATPVNAGELRCNGQIQSDNLTGLEKIKDNTVKLDGYQNQFSESVRNAREKLACVLQQAAEIKTDAIDKNTVSTDAASTSSSRITPHAKNVLDEMRAAKSATALDALWAKHSNHMPFSDYIAVKREYENIRRNLN